MASTLYSRSHASTQALHPADQFTPRRLGTPHPKHDRLGMRYGYVSPIRSALANFNSAVPIMYWLILRGCPVRPEDFPPGPDKKLDGMSGGGGCFRYMMPRFKLLIRIEKTLARYDLIVREIRPVEALLHGTLEVRACILAYLSGVDGQEIARLRRAHVTLISLKDFRDRHTMRDVTDEEYYGLYTEA